MNYSNLGYMYIFFFISALLHLIPCFVLYSLFTDGIESSHEIEIVVRRSQKVKKETVSIPDLSSKSPTSKGINELNSDAVQKINTSIQNNIRYPEVARRMGWEGVTLIQVVIDEQKRVLALLKESSGHRVLDQTALNAVSSWNFPEKFAQKKIVLKFNFFLK